MSRAPALGKGSLVALLTALLFGLSTPVSKMLGEAVDPFMLAGLF